MGRYVTYEQFSDRVMPDNIALCNPSLATDDLVAVVESLITRAEMTVEMYIGNYYNVPLPNNTITVQEWVLSLAEYELYKRAAGSNVPSKYKDDQARVMKELEAVRDGKMRIPYLPQSYSGSISVITDAPKFTENAMLGMDEMEGKVSDFI